MSRLEELAIGLVKAWDAENQAKDKEEDFKAEWYATNLNLSVNYPPFKALVVERFRLHKEVQNAEVALGDYIHKVYDRELKARPEEQEFIEVDGWGVPGQ